MPVCDLKGVGLLVQYAVVEVRGRAGRPSLSMIGRYFCPGRATMQEREGIRTIGASRPNATVLAASSARSKAYRGRVPHFLGAS